MSWKKITDMRLSGSRLHICDMRLGSSEDVILVELENGIYTIWDFPFKIDKIIVALYYINTYIKFTQNPMGENTKYSYSALNFALKQGFCKVLISISEYFGSLYG